MELKGEGHYKIVKGNDETKVEFGESILGL